MSLLEERDEEFTLRDYVAEPPDRAELERLLAMIGTDDPRDIARGKHEAFVAGDLADADPGTVLDALVEHPDMLERPIVVRGDRAVVARPPENLLELL